MLTINRIADQLPPDFAELLSASQRQGIRNMTLLFEHWQDGTERFDGEGEALFAAKSGEMLLGMAGVSVERNLETRAMRMRRLYVLPNYRRQGIASSLAQRCIDHGSETADLLTCNARASKATGPFWEHMGFAPIDWPNITHCLRKSAP